MSSLLVVGPAKEGKAEIEQAFRDPKGQRFAIGGPCKPAVLIFNFQRAFPRRRGLTARFRRSFSTFQLADLITESRHLALFGNSCSQTAPDIRVGFVWRRAAAGFALRRWFRFHSGSGVTILGSFGSPSAGLNRVEFERNLGSFGGRADRRFQVRFVIANGWGKWPILGSFGISLS
jgi:hypothetical protein